MKIPFTKMHSCGNDYILLNCMERNIFEFFRTFSFDMFVPPASMRRFGIGSDGVVAVLPSKNADAEIKVFCTDGREEKLNVNAIICTSKFLYENNYVKNEKIKIDTLDGIKNSLLYIKDGAASCCEISVGKADFSARFASLPKEKGIKHGQLHVGSDIFAFDCTLLGDEYVVSFCDDVYSFDIEQIGQRLNKNMSLSSGTDIILAQFLTMGHVKIRSWKRGCGETFSCGTGACCAIAIGAKKNLCRTNTYISADTIGGTFHIYTDSDFNVSIIGECEKIYDGIYDRDFD